MLSSWQQHVQPHGPLIQLGEGLWQVTGSLKRSPLPRNMVVWRSPNQSLLIHSAICLDEETMQELDALGEVSHIVVPCELHCADIVPYHQRYPNAKVLCPTCAQAKVEERIPNSQAMEEGLVDLGVVLHRPPV